MHGSVKVWQETITLPTWTTGAEDPNPMFLEKRVYQGSSGAVYPYGVIDTLTGEREMRDYQAVWLENDFIRVMLLPELGGRIHRAYDKVKQRDFVYYNEVVKPALVGLLGPWISGGIEFNWPQHHRPTTFMPVDFTRQAGENGEQTVWMGEVEPMRGLQVMTGFTLYPDRALIEITGKVFNGNVTPRHFLWWANPAVKGGDAHQSVFPPDVTAVFDHGKRDVSAFLSPRVLTTKWTIRREWISPATEMYQYQPPTWLKNQITILSGLTITMNEVACCTLPITMSRRVKNSGAGVTMILARPGIVI
jgi:hypothetical protein